ncbi:DUF433 domain-containing protein [Kribbella sp. NPDC051770]|uniref:DUF433 domain-containing protein n=1 Tax=Kribbella sp. NPDC051770 TaxID=3155413 RepID=UPI00343E9DCC
MAYRPQLAAALSGASVHQLAYWRKSTASEGPLLVPEVSQQPLLYSFRDVIALRTTVYLRKRISLQRVRRAIQSLYDLGEGEHLSTYRLVAQGNSVVLIAPDDSPAVDLVDHPGHQVTVVMSDVLQAFVTADQVPVPDLLHPRDALQVDPEIRGGHPVILGTRVPFEVVAGLLRDGVAAEAIADFYPSVGAAAATDALDFAEYVDRFGRTSAA